MNAKSKNVSLILLAVTALVCVRVMLMLFNDVEGPNLLIVTVMAAVVYFLSLAAYMLKTSNNKKFMFAFLIQIVLVSGFYFLA